MNIVFPLCRVFISFEEIENKPCNLCSLIRRSEEKVLSQFDTESERLPLKFDEKLVKVTIFF